MISKGSCDTEYSWMLKFQLCPHRNKLHFKIHNTITINVFTIIYILKWLFYCIFYQISAVIVNIKDFSKTLTYPKVFSFYSSYVLSLYFTSFILLQVIQVLCPNHTRSVQLTCTNKHDCMILHWHDHCIYCTNVHIIVTEIYYMNEWMNEWMNDAII